MMKIYLIVAVLVAKCLSLCPDGFTLRRGITGNLCAGFLEEQSYQEGVRACESLGGNVVSDLFAKIPHYEPLLSSMSYWLHTTENEQCTYVASGERTTGDCDEKRVFLCHLIVHQERRQLAISPKSCTLDSHCNAPSQGYCSNGFCVCYDYHYWPSEGCSDRHDQPEKDPDHYCRAGYKDEWCSNMGTCSTDGTVCICDAPQRWSVDRCSEWHSSGNPPTLAPTRVPTNKPVAAPTPIPTHNPTFSPTSVPTFKPTALPTIIPTFQPSSAPTFTPTFSPTPVPTSAPTAVPTAQPTRAPTVPPTNAPTFSPTAAPTSAPTAQPTSAPTISPTFKPTASPTSAPTASPTSAPTVTPTAQPTSAPTISPTSAPTVIPTAQPTSAPTITPTFKPTCSPTSAPTASPTSAPTVTPTAQPTSAPTTSPTSAPTVMPTAQPTSAPTISPTFKPTASPTSAPTVTPTAQPTSAPTISPTSAPTASPTSAPTVMPTAQPTSAPTTSPTSAPTASPTSAPTVMPTAQPTSAPTISPTSAPTNFPTNVPTVSPTHSPTSSPTNKPTTHPTTVPTAVPSVSPSCSPTVVPTVLPTVTPTTVPSSVPTLSPTSAPSVSPTAHPTNAPNSPPSTYVPTVAPTLVPTSVPSSFPTAAPTYIPTASPTNVPSLQPTMSPTSFPTLSPTAVPTAAPSVSPSCSPTVVPTSLPTLVPTLNPTVIPTEAPSNDPSLVPTLAPTHHPTASPTGDPTLQPTLSPTPIPTSSPTAVPTTAPSIAPSCSPTVVPTALPTVTPTAVPSSVPTLSPTSAPSVSPTLSPTSAPSVSPTAHPTNAPNSPPSTDMPTVAPTVLPTSVPTFNPTASPTNVPSLQLTMSPTSIPTLSPTDAPTAAPSVSPSCSPTVVPTSLPTLVPTLNPTVSPTEAPTSDPSLVPTLAPTHHPTVLPTVIPTAVPSSVPTLSPTSAPSVSPTAHPTNAPNAPPSTYVPTVSPTVIPTSVPTFNPTVSPTEALTNDPSLVPTLAPTHLPTASPTSDPTLQPTVSPTSIPTSSPTDAPTAAPSIAPSCSPTADPTVIPTSVPTHASTVFPSGIPTVNPTRHPTISPTAFPTRSPTTFPSRMPIAVNVPTSFPTVAPTLPAPAILSVQASSTMNAITTTVIMMGQGRAYCGVFVTGSIAVPTREMVSYQNTYGLAQSSTAIVTLRNLIPSTMYDLYCYSTSVNGQSVMSQSAMIATKTTVVTGCCKKIKVTLKSGAFVAGTDIAKAVSIDVGGMPSDSIDITVAAHAGSQTFNAFHPTIISLNKNSITSTYDLWLLGSKLSPASYTLRAAVTGTSASQYSLEYIGSQTFIVNTADAEPTTPVLASGQFSSNGQSVIISFDAPTDRANLAITFTCSVLFSVDFIPVPSQCQWTDDQTIVMSVAGISTVNVGSAVRLLSHKVRAKCTVNPEICSAWTPVPSTSITIASATSPQAPVVALSLPVTVSYCDRPVLDLTASSGSLGRAWMNVSFTVTGTDTGSVIALQSFFQSSYKISPPVAMPAGTLVPNHQYRITVELCNFLHRCSASSVDMSVVETIFPSVSILGLPTRSISVNAPLTLSSNAYVLNCDGEKLTTEFTYVWRVYKDNALIALPSQSIDPTKYKIPAFSLTAASVYRMEVTATRAGNAISASASTTVVVLTGNLVARISGGQGQLLRYGETLLLDASRSYDEDRQGLALENAETYGLTFSWECVQMSPQFSEFCGLSLALDSTRSKATVSAIDDTTIDATYQVDVLLSDAVRQSRFSVLVTVLPPDAPVISLSSTLGDMKLNPSATLSILASVSSTVPVHSSWSLSDTSISLTDASLTPVTKYITKSTELFNFVLKPGTLTGHSSMTFTLTAGTSTSHITIPVNTPPKGGIFTVDPSEGLEMSTPFSVSASEWADEDLPLMYDFVYTVHSLTLVALAKSEKSFGTIRLPAGSDTANYLVTCKLRVYDSYSSATTAEQAVVVNPNGGSSQVGDVVAEKLQGENSVDEMKQLLAMAGTIINSKSCSGAPDCAAQHREPCSDIPDTCGPCQMNYYGQIGSANSPCVSLSEYLDVINNAPSYASCTDSSTCGLWETCTEGVCHLQSKSLECSEHGTPQFVSVHTGYEFAECSIIDINCEAVCTCDEGFGGSSCGVSVDDLHALQETRQLLLSGLSTLSTMEDAAPDSVSSWISGLISIAQDADELNDESSLNAIELASVILSAGIDVSLAADEAEDILFALDTASVASVTSIGRRRLSASSMKQVNAALDSYAVIMSSTMVPGQVSTEVVGDALRVAAHALEAIDGFVSASLPLSATEVATGVSSSSVKISGVNSPLRIVTSSKHAKLFGDEFISHPFHLSVADWNPVTDDEELEVTFSIVNNKAVDYVTIESNITYNTSCTIGDSAAYVYLCADSGVEINHQCNGTNQYMLSTQCPSITLTPYCRLLDEDGKMTSDCEVVSYTSETTTCSCSLRAATRRHLKEEDYKYTGIEIATISEFAANDFKDTIVEFDSIDSVDDLGRVLIVIVMYGSMWAGGFLGIALCSLSHAHSVATKDKRVSALEKKKAIANCTRTGDAVKAYLAAYVNEVFPTVFSAQSKLSRLYHEICKHHRYFVLFTATGENGNKTRMITGMHLLTVQAMLMFMLAVLYDLQFPEDDGSCDKFTTEDACLEEKSMFDYSTTKCKWKDNGVDTFCKYRSPEFTWLMIILLSILVAVFTAPINLLVDYLFCDILSAPTADAVKVAAEESAIRKAGRRMSNAVRRASVTLSKTATSVKNRMSFLSWKGSDGATMTRVLPESTIEAHTMLMQAGAMKDILDNARLSISDMETSHRSTQTQAQATFEKKSMYMQRLSRATSFNEIPTTERLFLELWEDLNLQRRVLKRNEREGFDILWGVDPTGEFATRRQKFLCMGRGMDTAELIKSEISYVLKEAKEKQEKLRFATDIQIGLEILHLFVLDLLGRHTPAAKIFLQKTETDFRHSMVVSYWIKSLAWMAVVVINLFFVYFSMIRGIQRGLQWQRMYLFACILQFIIEIVFYETSECAVVQFFIPDLACNEIRSASFAIQQTLQRLCSLATQGTAGVLDATRYLFVSTNLAMAFPDLIESVIVLSYHNHLPGEIGKHWKFTEGTAGTRYASRVAKFTLTGFITSYLQKLGSTSPTLQRVLVHSVQPLFLSAIIVLWIFIVNNPIWSIPIAALVLYEIYVIIKNMKWKRQEVVPAVVPEIRGRKPRSATIESDSSDDVAPLNQPASPRPIRKVTVSTLPTLTLETVTECKHDEDTDSSASLNLFLHDHDEVSSSSSEEEESLDGYGSLSESDSDVPIRLPILVDSDTPNV